MKWCWNEVGSCVFDSGTVTTVQLTLSGLVFPFGLMSTTLEDLIAETLRKALAFVSRTILLLLQLNLGALVAVWPCYDTMEIVVIIIVVIISVLKSHFVHRLRLD